MYFITNGYKHFLETNSSEATCSFNLHSKPVDEYGIEALQ